MQLSSVRASGFSGTALRPPSMATSPVQAWPQVTLLRRTLPAVSPPPPARGGNICQARKDGEETGAQRKGGEIVDTQRKGGEERGSRRELLLRSSSAALLASILHLSGTRPSNIGVRGSPPQLSLCPPTPNCVSTSEELNDPGHYIPPWTYNPEDGRGRTKPASRKQAFAELKEAVTTVKPDGFTPRIVKETDDYIYVEYESNLFGFVDDVEFWFPPGERPIVEYRSASRLGESDLDINRKRIKALRQYLQTKGWASTGF